MDRYTFIIQLIAAIPPTLVAVIALIKTLRRIDQVHDQVNGRMDQLLDVTKQASIAEGRKQIRAEIANAAAPPIPSDPTKE